MKFDRISVDPRVMDGVPCIRGLRLPLATVIGMLAEGMDEGEILHSYPDLEAEDLRQALAFAAAALTERHLPLAAAHG